MLLGLEICFAILLMFDFILKFLVTFYYFCVCVKLIYQDNMSMEEERCEEMTPITRLELSGNENEEEPSSTMSVITKVLDSHLPTCDKKYTFDCWNQESKMRMEKHIR